MNPGPAGTCGAKGANGAPCSANDQCASNVCGTAGTGNCCAMSCSPVGGTCGATGCDGSGACVYAPMGTVCGAPSCTGGMETTQPMCNGMGTCAGNTVSCGNYVCGATACLSSCSPPNSKAGDASCATGYFCNNGNACVQARTFGMPCDRGRQCKTGTCCGCGTCGNSPC